MVKKFNLFSHLLILSFMSILVSIWWYTTIPLHMFTQVHPLFRDSISVPNFIKGSQTFGWKNLSKAIEERNHEEIWVFVNSIILWLTEYLITEPLTAINASCFPPVLQRKEGINCALGLSPYSKKIGVLIQFGFEVDTLEIHLNEVLDVVDKVFIIESTRTHGGMFRKPLIWDQMNGQERFGRFLPKIVHFVVDDADLANITNVKVPTNGSFSWNSEQLQEMLRWKKFLEWNKGTEFFNETDLLGFGDTDEVPRRETLNYLKHCILPSDPIDVGIWFPFGTIDQAYITDWPVKGHPFSLGDPTFWSLKAALNFSIMNPAKYPSRNRGLSNGHVLGGMHMSNYGFLPSLIVKSLSISEGNYDSIQQVVNFGLSAKNQNLAALQKYYWDLPRPPKSKIFDLKMANMTDEEKRELVVLPWFYNCNRDRYPAWKGNLDSRLY